LQELEELLQRELQWSKGRMGQELAAVEAHVRRYHASRYQSACKPRAA